MATPRIRIAATIIVSGVIFAMTLQHTIGTPQPPRTSVKPGNEIFVETILESGTLRGVNDLRIRSPFTRAMTVVDFAEDMSNVERGDVVLRFDDSATRDAVSAARSNLSDLQAQLSVAKTRMVSLEQQLETVKQLVQLRERLAAATVEIATTESDGIVGRKTMLTKSIEGQERIHTLYQATQLDAAFGQSSPLEKLQIQSGTIETETRLAELRHELSLISASVVEKPALEAAVQVEELKLHGQQEVADVQEAVLNSQNEIQNLTQKQSDAKSHLDRAESELAACTVIAPRSGVLVHSPQLNTRAAEPFVLQQGATIPPGSDLFHLPDMSHFEIEGRLNSAKVSRVRVGQSVVFEIDGFANLALTGKVKSIAADALPGTWPNTDLKEFPFVVEIDAESEKAAKQSLRPGLSCVLRIDVKDK